MLVFPATHVAKLAATTAPVFLVLFSGAVRWIKAKLVEGLTAYLAIQHLQKQTFLNFKMALKIYKLPDMMRFCIIWCCVLLQLNCIVITNLKQIKEGQRIRSIISIKIEQNVLSGYLMLPFTGT